ncbi:type III secretion system stator protein SctL [Pseudomonas sp. D1-1]|uniref:type III secretion system stator protein SctL n=1 Tax=Pseudomonas sp. D1-1 TaxID=1040793 RepID=UPI003DA94B27
MIVRQERFADYRTAIDVLSQARADADALVLQAENLRQEYLDQALAEFWGQASCFLQALEAERQQCRNSVIDVCRELLNIVIDRLFDEFQPQERARILLEHLAASRAYPTGSATLRCHPELFSEVQAWLAADNASALWQLREDITMPLQSIRLSTDAGEYDVDWIGLQRSFRATAI